MTSDAIREMRALLAARPAAAPETAPSLTRAFQSMFTPSAKRASDTVGRELAQPRSADSDGGPARGAPRNRRQGEGAPASDASAPEAAVNFEAPPAPSPSPAPLPQEALIAAFGPRLSAFGRRSAAPGVPPSTSTDAMELKEPLATTEIVDDRRIAASASEIPFFDDDLKDDPAPPRLSRFGLKPFLAAETPAEPAPPVPPTPPQELQRAFLLADLAAKLASHGHDVDQQLASAPTAVTSREAVLAELASALAREGVRLSGHVAAFCESVEPAPDGAAPS